MAVRADLENSVSGILTRFLSHQRISQMATRTSLHKPLDPLEVLLEGILTFLRKPIATCDKMYTFKRLASLRLSYYM